jgi:hypothetical protein
VRLRPPLIAAFVALAWAPNAAAYRPFDSTDASVAEAGKLEFELGPIGYLAEGRKHFLVAPALIANLGLSRSWELVLQGRHLLLVGDAQGEARSRVVDTGLFLKGVLRDGTLQDGVGPSVAVEAGPLLPTVNGEPGAGASAAVIVSQRWSSLTMHLNTAAALTRAGRLDLFGGAIVEGPYRWVVRPVAEVFLEREFDTSFAISGLLGAIWRTREELSLDIGLRAARLNGAFVGEFRAGLTWSFGLR